MERERARIALLIPLAVFTLAAALAVFIGWLLHQVPHEAAPLAALVLTLGVTAAGFIASYAVSEPRSGAQQ
ncbi:MAG: hypothetical protein GEU73_09880 [Chloroflexi bacterium]|nr:hypothetical protein [Chloroflexota bacterium]